MYGLFETLTYQIQTFPEKCQASLQWNSTYQRGYTAICSLRTQMYNVYWMMMALKLHTIATMNINIKIALVSNYDHSAP